MRQFLQQTRAGVRLNCMVCRFVAVFLVAGLAWGASAPDIAKRLAQRAKLARDGGEVVRAYLLYGEAAKRDPAEPSYAASRNALAATATLLMKTQLEEPVVAADIVAAEKEAAQAEEAANPPPPGEVELKRSLASYPHIEAKDIVRDFDLHGNEISLIQQVVAAYGVRAAWDPQLDAKNDLQLHITQANFRAAMEALTIATNTFVFPISPNTLFFAHDSEAKRNELEPLILLTVPLPDSLGEKDLIDVANAVRGVLNLRTFGWDSVSRTVFIKDRVTRALAARSLLQALLVPKAQVSLEVQVLTIDADTNYHYGISPPSNFSLLNFGRLNLGSVMSSVGTFTRFFTFGGGLSLFGLGVADATLFASYTKSVAKANYEAVMVTADGEPATLHYGEKFPIAQTLYTGFAQSTSSIYTPLPQITQEDLGLSLKVTPHVNGSGDVALDIDAEFKALGTLTLNTVPSISQRKFTGNVILREGEWAMLAGLDQNSMTNSRNGLLGLANIPGVNQLLSENTRDKATSETLVLIKPQVTRLPMSATISPQYLLGPARGIKVLL